VTHFGSACSAADLQQTTADALQDTNSQWGQQQTLIQQWQQEHTADRIYEPDEQVQQLRPRAHSLSVTMPAERLNAAMLSSTTCFPFLAVFFLGQPRIVLSVFCLTLSMQQRQAVLQVALSWGASHARYCTVPWPTLSLGRCVH
jgi:hypothetical protein